MNEPIDIKALDEYLKAGGSSDISQRYRELGRDDVPPELDRRVLDEARAAVANGGARRAKSLLRWSAPVALAASVVLVVTVVIENGVPKDTAYVVQPASEESKLLYDEQPTQAPQAAQGPQFAPEAPAPQPAAAPAAPPPEPSLAKKEVEEQRFVPEEVRVEAKARRDQAESVPVTAAPVLIDAEPPRAAGNARETGERGEAEAEADSDVSSVAVTGGRTRRATGRTAGPRNTISGAALSGEMRQSADNSTDNSAQAEQRDPEKWLEQIRDLRREGRSDEADREWQRFTEAHPDFEVADDDIARKH